MKLFYALLIWCARFELALAKAAPARNQTHIARLQDDVSDFERALLREEMGL